MRILTTIGLVLFASTGTYATENVFPNSEPVSPATRFIAANPSAGGNLNYLINAQCREEFGCTRTTTSVADPVNQYNYPTALNLGTYGPMKIKFTGNKVKFKVKF